MNSCILWAYRNINHSLALNRSTFYLKDYALNCLLLPSYADLSQVIVVYSGHKYWLVRVKLGFRSKSDGPRYFTFLFAAGTHGRCSCLNTKVLDCSQISNVNNASVTKACRMGITCRPNAGGTGVQNTPVPKIGHSTSCYQKRIDSTLDAGYRHVS